MQEHFPQARIGPSVSTGFTDSHWLREQGVTSYGFSPFVIPVADVGGFHGNNERISTDNMVNGTALLIELLQRFVVD